MATQRRPGRRRTSSSESSSRSWTRERKTRVARGEGVRGSDGQARRRGDASARGDGGAGPGLRGCIRRRKRRKRRRRPVVRVVPLGIGRRRARRRRRRFRSRDPSRVRERRDDESVQSVGTPSGRSGSSRNCDPANYDFARVHSQGPDRRRRRLPRREILRRRAQGRERVRRVYRRGAFGSVRELVRTE